MILEELAERATSEHESGKISNSPFILDQLPEFLGSPDFRIRRITCQLVGTLASHKATVPAILGVTPGLRLVIFFLSAFVSSLNRGSHDSSDELEDLDVIARAAWAL